MTDIQKLDEIIAEMREAAKVERKREWGMDLAITAHDCDDWAERLESLKVAQPSADEPVAQQCTFQFGTIECTGTGLLWDADMDGWNEDFNEGPCPECNTAEYLKAAKADAESSSFYSNGSSSGTGLTVWLDAAATALRWNRQAAVVALKEIGTVGCAVDVEDEAGNSITAIVPISFSESAQSVVAKGLPTMEARPQPAPSVPEHYAEARRYRYLRERDLETINKGGVFAGLTTGLGYGGKVLNGDDLDSAIDAALLAAAPEAPR